MVFNPWLDLLVLIIGLGIGYFVRVFVVSLGKDSLEQKLKRRRQAAETEANNIILEAQEKTVALLEGAKKEDKERRAELRKHEEGLFERGESLNKQVADVLRREGDIEQSKGEIAKREAAIAETAKKAVQELERISGLSQEVARDELMRSVRAQN